jgi:hypothetical protein
MAQLDSGYAKLRRAHVGLPWVFKEPRYWTDPL